MPSKRPAPRLPMLEERQLSEPQRTLLSALRGSPRGQSLAIRGPFAAWMHAPEFGQLAQALGAHCRYKTAVAPRLSEFAILCTARFWRAQYEWFAHAPIAEKRRRQGQDHHAICAPDASRRSAPKDERAIYAFVQELYKARRVSERTYQARAGICWAMQRPSSSPASSAITLWWR